MGGCAFIVSGLGHGRKPRHVRIRSAYALIANIPGDCRDFAFVPQADMLPDFDSRLLDHLIGAGE